MRNVDDYSWHSDTKRHGMPERGLIVVRDIEFNNEELTESGNEALEPGQCSRVWVSGMASPEAVDLINAREIICWDSLEMDVTTLPPSGFLGYLKSLHIRTGSILVYYFHFTWGGNTETEYAWIFGEDEEVLVYKDEESSYQFKGGDPRVINESVLKRTLKLLGLDLPTPFFALHTGTFDWRKWRIECDRA